MKEPTAEKKVARFLIAARQVGVPIYVGIDPGVTGAVGFICGQSYAVVDIPASKVRRGKGRKIAFDYHGIADLFKEFKGVRHRVRVCLEKPPPSMGPGRGSAYGQFCVGVAYALWPVFVVSKGFQLEEVAPGIWKKAMKLLKAEKDESRLMASRMFPKAELRLKKHHNRAEALLLAEYLRRERR